MKEFEILTNWRLEPGARPLTVNTYHSIGFGGVAADLQPGEQWYRRYGNFFPLVAEFLSDDLVRIDARKAEIDEDEWQRALRFGTEYLETHGEKARDGRPLRCGTPAPVRWRR